MTIKNKNECIEEINKYIIGCCHDSEGNCEFDGLDENQIETIVDIFNKYNCI